MNTVITSREAILQVSRKLAVEQGWKTINMRTVAAACGVAVGSIYNYFPSKSDLMVAIVEDVWREIFHMPNQSFEFNRFVDAIEWLFNSIKQGSAEYPGFFTIHSLGFADSEKEKGRQMMSQYMAHIQHSLQHVLENDKNIRPNAFDEHFTANDFIELIFSLVISSLLKQEQNCNKILQLIRHSIY